MMENGQRDSFLESCCQYLTEKLKTGNGMCLYPFAIPALIDLLNGEIEMLSIDRVSGGE